MNFYNVKNSQWEESGYLLIQEQKLGTREEFLNLSLTKLNELRFLITIEDSNLFVKADLTEEEYRSMIDTFDKLIEPEIKKGLHNLIVGNKVKEEWNEKVFYFETDIYYGFYAWETNA